MCVCEGLYVCIQHMYIYICNIQSVCVLMYVYIYIILPPNLFKYIDINISSYLNDNIMDHFHLFSLKMNKY